MDETEQAKNIVIDAREQQGLHEVNARQSVANALESIPISRVNEVHFLGREVTRSYRNGKEKMRKRDYDFIMRRDSSIPKARDRTLKRMRAMLDRFPTGVPDRAKCFFCGLVTGWTLSEMIGFLDADEVKELLPTGRTAGVRKAIPNGRGVQAPEVEALTDDQVLGDWWFHVWMGMKNDLYFFHRKGREMPERSVLAWLGFLRGELEGKSISQAEYKKLRSLLPAVNDDLTPLVVATL